MNPVRTLFCRHRTNLRSFSRLCGLNQSNNMSAQTDTKSMKPDLTQPPPPQTVAIAQTELIPVPQPEGEAKKYSTKIENIVNEIIKLNLLEVGELSELLKKRLNLPDAPVMPLSAFGAMAASAPASEVEEEVEVKKVKTNFTVKLMKFDEKQKVPLIKEVKNLLEGMNLVQAKKFVESAPTLVKADVSKEEAEKLKEALSKVGAEIVIE